MLKKNDSFESERLVFRGINEMDVDLLVRWRSDMDLIRFFRNPEPITLQSHTEWYSNMYLMNDSRFDFILCEKSSMQKIGTVGVSVIDKDKRSCEISYMIAERGFQRKGFAQEAVTTMIALMRENGFTKFYADIHQHNHASISMIEKLGFVLSSQRDGFSMYVMSEG